jgi:hypothetical protein
MARKDARFTVCCNPDFHKRIKDIADKNHRTLSSTVVLLVEKALELKLEEDYLNKML